MFREKIKDFLAAQGMIKGHSGAGTRTSEQEGMLVLVPDQGRSDTSSPHSPASVDSSDDHRRPNGHNISSTRYDPHYTSVSLSAQHSHNGYTSQRMSFSSARESSPLNLPRLPPAYHQPISDTGEILIAKKYVPDPILRLLNPDRKVRLPPSRALHPHPVFLQYHRSLFKGD